MGEAISEEKSRMSPSTHAGYATLLTHEWGRWLNSLPSAGRLALAAWLVLAILFASSSQRSAKSNKCAFPAEVGACRARRSVCAAFFLYSCARRMGTYVCS
jgi:hypothetical protein